MRMSKGLFPTLKEAPKEAEIVSHKLMIRAGLMRKLASGIYTYLPLGYRVIRKIENIIREEMDRAGAQEVLLPALSPQELWEESGRWGIYGPELMRIKDRHDRFFGLGPTHEEVITDLVRREVKSYKQLPLTLYQIQTKFRDEIRPRFGMLRAREFHMKDAYSFDRNEKGLEKNYKRMYQTYQNIFNRCGLKYKAVKADTGPIGGDVSHEFMVLAKTGEDQIVYCKKCGYAANVNRAEYRRSQVAGRRSQIKEEPLEKVETPGMKSVEEVTSFLKCKPENLVKTLIYKVDGNPVAILIRGEHEVNERKLEKLLKAKEISLADEETIEKVTGGPLGFSGPVGLNPTASGGRIEIIADSDVVGMKNMISGANEKDYHLININLDRDFKADKILDIRSVIPGDLCPKCKIKLIFSRGIEVGHVFKLGTKYSKDLKATFLDEKGRERPLIMGCYGIGLDRIMAANIEQNHDENGIIWPSSIAPYQVLVLIVNNQDKKQIKIAEEVYNSLEKEGIEVLFDDRDLRAGAKFKDADLMGIPLRITIGNKAMKGKKIEIKIRKNNKVHEIDRKNLIPKIQSFLK
ncbi:MAG TPA: proline--tRNA ligase [bacterium]|nr:proline--tRNA ligase [bacterium]